MRIGVDVGGTFTDVISVRDGVGRVAKVLSTPPSYDVGVIEGITALGMDERAAAELAEVIHGTTVATNAVLERRGARTALVTTRGFRDVLELRRLRIPKLYDPFWRKPPPIVERALRFEVDERVTAEGEPLRPVDEEEVLAIARALAETDVEAVAVCLLNSYVHPDHEEQVGEILRRELPQLRVSVSTEILREQGEYERSATAAVNAYVQPLMARYLDRLTGSLAKGGRAVPLMIMQSSGGLMTAAQAEVQPVFVLESGPAAGVIAARGIGRRASDSRTSIAFDMGGTTAKASLIEGGRVSRSPRVRGGRQRSPPAAGCSAARASCSGSRRSTSPRSALAAAASPGSIQAARCTSGPQAPGPIPAPPATAGAVCSRRSPTPTSCSVTSRRAGWPTASLEVSPSRCRTGRAASSRSASSSSPLEAASGIHKLANARMMRPLRRVSSERGRDPREFVLMAYGGSGPVHGAGLAEELAVPTVVVPALAGSTQQRRPAVRPARAARRQELQPRRARFAARGAPGRIRRHGNRSRPGSVVQGITFVRSAELRYKGQSWNIEVPVQGDPGEPATMAALIRDFENEHERLYGVRPEEGSPVVIRAHQSGGSWGPIRRISRLARREDPGSRAERAPARAAAFGGDRIDTPVLSRAEVGENALPARS